MDELERALAHDACERMQELLESAADEVLTAPLASIFRLPKEKVRSCRTSSVGSDLQCHAPATTWCRLRVGLPADHAAVVDTVSAWGLSRRAVFHTAADVGRAIVAALDDSARDVAADIRVRNDGSLLITSQLHMRRQRALGMLHCAACGAFCHGERGLRDHQHIKHTGSYEAAKDAVAIAKGTLVRHTVVGAHLADLWAARAAETERQKKALPAGLEAARDGDESALRKLVSQGWSALEVVDRHGSSALHYAAGSGRLSVCKYLVDVLGVPAGQAQSKDGRTALHLSLIHI